MGMEMEGHTMKQSLYDMGPSDIFSSIADSVFSPNAQESIWDTLSANSNLHQMKWLLEAFSAIDPRNRNALESAPITVFAVTDGGLRAFFSALNREHTDASEEVVRNLISRHLIYQKLFAHDMMKAGSVVMSDGTTVKVEVLQGGQIRLGNIATMRTLDVQSSNAVIHIIDAALYANDSAYIETCVRVSTDSTQDEECCEGFFSPLCIPCPGEAGVPCSGNGQVGHFYFSYCL
ncbi:uncharacterized protein [Diadema antillarum]|uniref:uncharacterized protein n=1 Tax=Diadema antillarum TaxID=105358 RepID=UPI003A87D019